MMYMTYEVNTKDEMNENLKTYRWKENTDTQKKTKKNKTNYKKKSKCQRWIVIGWTLKQTE